MFYLFDICLGFCGLLVCAVYAYIKHAHSGSRLFHQFLGIVWVVVTYIVSIWVEAVWNLMGQSGLGVTPNFWTCGLGVPPLFLPRSRVFGENPEERTRKNEDLFYNTMELILK